MSTALYELNDDDETHEFDYLSRRTRRSYGCCFTLRIQVVLLLLALRSDARDSALILPFSLVGGVSLTHQRFIAILGFCEGRGSSLLDHDEEF
jgi:hypothetical protein